MGRSAGFVFAIKVKRANRQLCTTESRLNSVYLEKLKQEAKLYKDKNTLIY